MVESRLVELQAARDAIRDDLDNCPSLAFLEGGRYTHAELKTIFDDLGVATIEPPSSAHMSD